MIDCEEEKGWLGDVELGASKSLVLFFSCFYSSIKIIKTLPPLSAAMAATIDDHRPPFYGGSTWCPFSILQGLDHVGNLNPSCVFSLGHCTFSPLNIVL